AAQYKYGKNRVEADARRLQTREEELLKRKEALRDRLAQLRRERKDLRAAMDASAGREGLGSGDCPGRVHTRDCTFHSAQDLTHTPLTEAGEVLGDLLQLLALTAEMVWRMAPASTGLGTESGARVAPLGRACAFLLAGAGAQLLTLGSSASIVMASLLAWCSACEHGLPRSRLY
ncbi:hypothetical protein P7K49_006041, partial [Saguinus oedipus]